MSAPFTKLAEPESDPPDEESEPEEEDEDEDEDDDEPPELLELPDLEPPPHPASTTAKTTMISNIDFHRPLGFFNMLFPP
jgi:hypothetical protein